MKDSIKKNIVLIIAFVLPVVLIIVVFLSVYLPSMLVKTDYDFIYVSCASNNNYYYYQCNDYALTYYTVVDGKLVASQIPEPQDLNNNKIPDRKEFSDVRIFFHDTSKNESREITMDEAQKLKLNSLITSPDGVTVSSNYNGGGDFYFFPFGGSSSSYGIYLVKGSGKDKLNLINSSDRYYYQNNFKFIGWVMPR